MDQTQKTRSTETKNAGSGDWGIKESLRRKPMQKRNLKGH